MAGKLAGFLRVLECFTGDVVVQVDQFVHQGLELGILRGKLLRQAGILENLIQELQVVVVQRLASVDFIPHSETEGTDDIAGSAAQIRQFIEREIDRGISPSKILLAGFSQGGVIALHTGVRYDQRLAGILALSTYLHDFTGTEKEATDANLAIPIMMAHGTADPMIPIMRAATSRENLIRLGYDVRWFDYPMGHQVCLEEIGEVSNFMQEIF